MYQIYAKLLLVCSLGLLVIDLHAQVATCGPTTGTSSSAAFGGSTLTSSSIVSSNGGAMSQASYNELLAQMPPQQSYQHIDELYAATQGTPYMFDEFQEGVLVLNSGYEAKVKLNYDAYQKGIVALDADDEKILLDGRYYKKAMINTESETIVFEKPNPRQNAQFYEVLYSDAGFAFFKEQVASYTPKKVSIVTTPAKFKQRTKYYVVDDGQKPIAVNLKKKSLYKHFPQIRVTAMTEILEHTDLKLNNESDYKALFAMLESK